MSFGGQTVGFVVLGTSGARDELGIKETTRTPTIVEGCRHRPLSSTEQARLETNVATQIWKTTAPPVPVAQSATATGELIVGGITYQIIAGAMVYADQEGDPYKVTILSTIKTGG